MENLEGMNWLNLSNLSKYSPIKLCTVIIIRATQSYFRSNYPSKI